MDTEARRVLIEFCQNESATGMRLPPLDGFEIECFETQVEMLGLGAERRASTLVVFKAERASSLRRSGSDECSELLGTPEQPRKLAAAAAEGAHELADRPSACIVHGVAAEPAAESPALLSRVGSLSRLSFSLQRSGSFSCLEAAEQLFRAGSSAERRSLSLSQEPPACRATSASSCPANKWMSPLESEQLPAGDSPGTAAIELGHSTTGQRAKPAASSAPARALIRIESQRVLDQSEFLSSSLKTTATEFQPEKSNVWYVSKGGIDHEGNIAVFKSEEASAVPTEGEPLPNLRRGFTHASGHAREIAAYKLDHKSWAGVPPTIAYKVELGGAVRDGSVQSYIAHHHSADEDDERNPRGPKDHMRYPAIQVHRIGVLDIRLFNSDRHGGNLLIREEPGQGVALVPIDHGLCLPAWDHLEMPTQPVWFGWQQAEEPFSDEVCGYIAELDLEADLQILYNCGLEPESCVTFRLCHILLHAAVCAMAPCSYTLRELGELIVQHRVDLPSTFASWVKQAREEAEAPEGSSCAAWLEENALGLLAQHMRNRLYARYTAATAYVQEALGAGGLERAISRDRLGIDAKGRARLDQLVAEPPRPPSAEMARLLGAQLRGCTREQLACVRAELCTPWWQYAQSISQIARQVRYPKLCPPEADAGSVVGESTEQDLQFDLN